MTPTSPVITATNALTARWCAQVGSDDVVVSAAGVWPLLALLASAADEPARSELSAALGRSADSAQSDALELIDLLHTGASTTAALGIWRRNDVPLKQDWSSLLPSHVLGVLTDQAALDYWAADETGGLIDTFPLELAPDILMILASALAARVRWQEPFESYPRDHNSSTDEADQQWLIRTTHDLAAAAVLDNTVTRIVVEGEGDLDVHLLLGEQDPGEVLATGLRALSGDADVRPASAVDSAPGLRVSVEQSVDPEDRLNMRLPSFEIASKHDLLEYSPLFGLQSVTDPNTSHLPLLSPVPLFVSRGRQDVLARFFAEGFEAAAVTAFGLALGSAPPPAEYRVTTVDANFDRPFGFLAVHRSSRLAVVAGWVSSPFEPLPR